jgi:cytochrome c-type biogenesis protein CcmH/NrfG
MRWFLVGLCAWLAWVGLQAVETPEDAYVRIYYLIQEADSLNAKGELQKAVARYLEAQAALRKLKTLYPTWQEKVVNFRLNYIASKLDPLLQRVPAQQTTPATPDQPAPAPAVSPAPAPAVAAPATSPATQTPAPSVPPPTPLPEPLVELTNQLKALHAEIERLSAQNTLLEAKLKEAWAVQPAAVDPHELAAARAQIVELQKERDLLRAALEQQKARWTNAVGATLLAQEQQILAEVKKRLAEQEQLAATLRSENTQLKQQNDALRQETDRLRQQNLALTQQVAQLTQKLQAAPAPAPVTSPASSTVAELQASNAALRAELVLLESRLNDVLRESRAARPPKDQRLEQQLAAARSTVKELERERAKLKKQLDRYAKELARRGGANLPPEPDETERQLEIARARLEALESKAVPYAPEELALFRLPQTNASASAALTVRKKFNDLPPGAAALLAEAQRAVDAGLLAEAEKRYRQVLSQHQTNLYTLAHLAAVQLDQDHLEDAEQTLQKALALDGQDAACLYLVGSLRFRQGRYDEALDALSQSARVNPDKPQTHLLLGKVLVHEGQRQAAEAAFRKAIQLQPGWGEPHYQLAVLYIQQQPPFPELAQWHYQKALAGGVARNPDLEKLLQEQRSAATP